MKRLYKQDWDRAIKRIVEQQALDKRMEKVSGPERISFCVSGATVGFYGDVHDEEKVRDLRRVLDKEFECGHQPWKREFSSWDGRFAWKKIITYPDGRYMHLVIDGTDPGNCKVTKKEEMQTVFESDCKPTEEILNGPDMEDAMDALEEADA